MLVVTKLDRLRCDVLDVSATVEKLDKLGIRVHCLALDGVDLTSSAEKMTMHVINVVAQCGEIYWLKKLKQACSEFKLKKKLLANRKRS